MSTPVSEATVEICNIRGLHARAAAKFCDLANSFDSAITVTCCRMSVGGGSLMALLMLGAGIGSDISIKAEGADAEDAVAALSSLVAAKFHEDC